MRTHDRHTRVHIMRNKYCDMLESLLHRALDKIYIHKHACIQNEYMYGLLHSCYCIYNYELVFILRIECLCLFSLRMNLMRCCLWTVQMLSSLSMSLSRGTKGWRSIVRTLTLSPNWTVSKQMSKQLLTRMLATYIHYSNTTQILAVQILPRSRN